MSTRVWMPVNPAVLRRWWDEQEVAPGPGHAVTAALREAWPEAGEEEREYAVLLAAADDAAAMLPVPGPRVVVVVEADAVETVEAADGGPGTGVRLLEPVPWRRVAAVHADPPGTEVAPGSSADDLADPGWYAVQEVPDWLHATGC